MTFATGEFATAALSGLDIQPIRTDTAKAKAVRPMLTTEEARTLRTELIFASGERVAVNLVGSGSEPSSLWLVLDRFRRLSDLPHGWDSYGAQPLSASAVRRCFGLLPSLLPDD